MAIYLKDFETEAVKVGHEEKEIKLMRQVITDLIALKKETGNYNISLEKEGLTWVLARQNKFNKPVDIVNFHAYNGSQDKVIASFKNVKDFGY